MPNTPSGVCRALLGSVYTLTPTHCGTGQTTGAIDLPIARESHTGLPVLPSTMLKGVARDVFKRRPGGDASPLVKRLFGPPTDSPDLEAGALIFTEGHLLALPVRSLNRPFLYATCPLVLERLERDLRAVAGGVFFPDDWALPDPGEVQAQVADPGLAGKALVLEDLIYESAEVATLTQLPALAKRFAELLPETEAATRQRLSLDLVVLHDNDLLDLARRTTPVQARIKLGAGKTTSAHLNDDGSKESGNLWYEETLPPDCLFTFFVLERSETMSAAAGGRRSDAATGAALDDFRSESSRSPHIQIGGNETVGQGRCWWSFRELKATED